MLPLTKQSLDEAPYKFSGAVAKLAGITFLSLAFSYWTIKPWFLTEGKTCCYIHQIFSWGSQLADHLLHQLHANKFSSTIHHRAIKSKQVFSGAVAGEKEDFCKGSFARTSFTLF
jgi:hypothetical protein